MPPKGWRKPALDYPETTPETASAARLLILLREIPDYLFVQAVAKANMVTHESRELVEAFRRNKA